MHQGEFFSPVVVPDCCGGCSHSPQGTDVQVDVAAAAAVAAAVGDDVGGNRLGCYSPHGDIPDPLGHDYASDLPDLSLTLHYEAGPCNVPVAIHVFSPLCPHQGVLALETGIWN